MGGESRVVGWGGRLNDWMRPRLDSRRDSLHTEATTTHRPVHHFSGTGWPFKTKLDTAGEGSYQGSTFRCTITVLFFWIPRRSELRVHIWVLHARIFRNTLPPPRSSTQTPTHARMHARTLAHGRRYSRRCCAALPTSPPGNLGSLDDAPTGSATVRRRLELQQHLNHVHVPHSAH